jgi:hypothetical protein
MTSPQSCLKASSKLTIYSQQYRSYHETTPISNSLINMKFVSVIFVASVAWTLAAEERGLQVLAKKWNITDPTFAYDSLGFDLDYQVSDFINDAMTTHTLWTSPGCQEGAVAVPPSILNSTKVPLGGDFDADNNGDGVRDQRLTVGVVPATIAGSNLYAEDTTTGSVTATVKFCVRFSLQTENATEVNFVETLVTLFVDLSDDFSIGNVTVAPKNKLLNTANQVYLLDGYQCNGANEGLVEDELTATRNQGSVIRVCVKPQAEAATAGIFMRSLDDFTFSRNSISQPAIIGYNEAATNGLTSLSCGNGFPLCSFDTILFAAFYSTTGVVVGSGTGSMQFGGARRLRGLQNEDDRSEAAAISAFDISFGTLTSGALAATSGVMAATALAMVGAFALI